MRQNPLPFKIFIGVIIFFLFIFILNFFSPQIRNYFHLASFPLEKNFWSAGQSASGFFESFFKYGTLAKENESLKNENQKLLSEITFLQAIKKSNEAQSDVSESCQNSDFELVMAGVIGQDTEDQLTINKGSDSGIMEGMPVINQQSVLFGKVVEVYKNFSKVMLISNKESIINVKVQQIQDQKPEKDVYGVVKGSGAQKAFLDLVPVDDAIEQGDVLITSALEGTFPKDVLVGRISKVEKNDQSPHQKAEVELFLDVKTDNLFVITNYKR